MLIGVKFWQFYTSRTCQINVNLDNYIHVSFAIMEKLGVSFLKDQYNSHKLPEINEAAKRTKIRTGERVPQNPEAQIQNYLDRFTEIINREPQAVKAKMLRALKKVLYRSYIIEKNDIPESVFLLEQRLAREAGHGVVEITDDFIEQKSELIISQQKTSLDHWVDHLSSSDAETYPDWIKYWVFKSLLNMGKMEKKEDETEGETEVVFKKRTRSTAAASPVLNHAALAKTINVVKEAVGKIKIENTSVALNDEEFTKLSNTQNFSKIYSQFLAEAPEYSKEGLEEIRGRWKIYRRGSDADELVDSLKGYPLEWCTADYNTAQGQLDGGDFYVYYSFDTNGESKIPRVAIRMEGSNIAEVRGIAPSQEIDPYVPSVVEEKMKDFGEQGKEYQKKARDMKYVTEIEKKSKNGTLTRTDLRFLYEVDGHIKGFGYDVDPRIEELLTPRDRNADLITIFTDSQAQVAETQNDMNDETVLLLGDLFVENDIDLPSHLKYIGGSVHIGNNIPSIIAHKLIDVREELQLQRTSKTSTTSTTAKSQTNSSTREGELGLQRSSKTSMDSTTMKSQSNLSTRERHVLLQTISVTSTTSTTAKSPTNSSMWEREPQLQHTSKTSTTSHQQSQTSSSTREREVLLQHTSKTSTTSHQQS